jgi:type IV secretory pathway component VirB8
MSIGMKELLKKKKRPRWQESKLERLERKQQIAFVIGITLTSLQVALCIMAVIMGVDIPWLWVIIMRG